MDVKVLRKPPSAMQPEDLPTQGSRLLGQCGSGTQCSEKKWVPTLVSMSLSLRHKSATYRAFALNLVILPMNTISGCKLRQLEGWSGVRGGGSWRFQISQGESVLESQVGARTQ